MAIWLVRAGSDGEYEQKFLEENRVYVTWDELNTDIGALNDRSELSAVLIDRSPDVKARKISNHVSQIWPFAHRMEQGDWVVLPSKKQPVIYVGEITSNYQFNPDGPNPFYHHREIKWVAQEIPRSHFSQDILYSFGAFMTICQIKRNDAERRIRAMAENQWKPESNTAVLNIGSAQTENNNNEDASDDSSVIDLEDSAKIQIRRLIEARFKGHNLTRLVAAILRAKGFTLWQSPEGADGGVDILAGDGPMGFGTQTICVEVKSGTQMTDRPTVDKLLGAMTKFNAQMGLFVAWGGFKSNVQKELASSFFKMRLWTQDDLLEQLFEHYDKLDDEIKVELPLKRVWVAALSEDD